jgi:hypothetical protein
MDKFNFDLWYRKKLFQPCSEKTLAKITTDLIGSYRKYADSAEERKESARRWLPERMAERVCDKIDIKATKYTADANYLEKDLDFKVRFVSNYGYIDRDMLLQATEILGENHPVKVKTPEGSKSEVLKNVAITDEQQVYVSMGTYDKLHKEWQI